MPRLGIVLCITELEVGGAEKCLAEIAARLDRQRFDVSVVALAPPPAGNPAIVERLHAAQVPVDFLGVTRPRQFPLALWRLTRYLRRKQPQVVQTFLFHANIVGRIAARLAGVRRVVSGIRVAERSCAWHLRWDRRTAGLVDRHVCVSQSVAEFSATVAGLPRERLVVIPNGVDVARFGLAHDAHEHHDAARPDGLPAGRRFVICIGRLEPQKRVDWLLRNAPDWLQTCPEHDLLIVGDGPERTHLETLCKQADLAGRVRFLGWRPDVPQLLSASDLLVLPSRWEGMPNVVLEAMASGLPVVSTEVEGVRELLGSAAAGQVVPQEDATAFNAQVVHWLCHPADARRQGASNRARVEAEFSFEQMVARYERLYEELLAAKPAALPVA